MAIDPIIGGALIQTGGSLLGGLFGKKKKPPSIEAQLGDQRRLIHGQISSTMEAANAYGVHPLVALGLNPGSGGASYSVGGDDRGVVSNTLSDLGQNLGSAIAKRQSPEEKVLQSIVSKQAVERGDLENELLKSQIAQIRSSITPSIPTSNATEMIAGQGDTGAEYIANQLVKHETSDGREAGMPSSWTKVKTKMGDMIVPSKDFQDRAEDIPLIGWEWLIRNKFPELVMDVYNAMPKKQRYSKIDWSKVNNR